MIFLLLILTEENTVMLTYSVKWQVGKIMIISVSNILHPFQKYNDFGSLFSFCGETKGFFVFPSRKE